MAWYDERGAGLGKEFLREVDASLLSIQRNPELYPLIHNQIRRAMLRRFPYGIFYYLRDERIVVLACFHGRRDPKSWQSRGEE